MPIHVEPKSLGTKLFYITLRNRFSKEKELEEKLILIHLINLNSKVKSYQIINSGTYLYILKSQSLQDLEP